MIRKLLALSLSSSLMLSGCGQGTLSTPAGNGNANATPPPAPPTPTTASSAIKHVVVIFGENVSFDHYFGTYPNALNNPGGTPFTTAAGTPIPNNYVKNPSLLTANPNLNGANNSTALNSVAANPFRLDIAQAATGDQDHAYTPEEQSFDGGKMDLFPLYVGTPDSAAAPSVPNLAVSTGAPAIANTTGLTMGYFDGNTVTALWNYAQHYAMNDHSFGTTFGPSTPGAINLASGQTNGVINPLNVSYAIVADGNGGFTDINDADPTGDLCSKASANFSMSGKNIGDLLNTANVSWGFFEGGFDLTVTNSNGTTGCARSSASANIPGRRVNVDYIPHHQPFQYYASTANLNHNRPTKGVAIGAADAAGANHQYDMHDFTDALAAGSMPAVSFLKAPGIQDGHAGYSDPLDEQTFIVNTINAIEKSQFWSSTAIIINYDDSDGWYDHLNDFVNGSATVADSLNGAGVCISSTAAGNALPGVTAATLHAQGRCGYGPRLPLMVISPWAKKNSIDSTVTDQSSIPRFIEDVFLSGTRIGGGSFDSIAGPLTSMFDFSNGATPPNPNIVTLDPTTGKVTSNN
ncbi:MAG: alkaline phosphatase family protein [Acidobacteriota bacterium]|nr:alkaline phosphatase family protein [Acidobacteriota bacterium]